MMRFGIIRSFDRTRGTGLITPDGWDSSIPFSQIGVSQNRLIHLHVGKRYSFHVVGADKGQAAIDLIPVEPTSSRPSIFRTALEEHQMKMARDNWADDGGAIRSEGIEDAEPSQFVEGERYPIFEHTFIGDWQHVAIPLGLTALAVTGAMAVAIS